MAQLQFDPIATAVGGLEVVTFRCFVSQPLSDEQSEETVYCLVADPWFRDTMKLLVKESDVVASIPGAGRPDQMSIVWVKADAVVDGQGTTALNAATNMLTAEITPAGGGAFPPPPPHPR
jgi:hypothetical protein